MKRYGPSRRRALDASAALRIFVRHPEKTFATISASNGLMHRSNLAALFDHLVSAAKQRGWQLETKSLGGLEVDDQFEFSLLVKGDVSRIGTFEDLVDEVGEAPPIFHVVKRVDHQSARVDKCAIW